MSLVTDLRSNINPILKIRDDLGAAKAAVYLVTRTWSGAEPGDGVSSDVETLVTPSPKIIQYTDDFRIREGGAVRQGDLKLKWISKQSFPTKSTIDGSSASQKVEKFYKVGGVLYRVITVDDRLLCWDVLIRRVTNG